MNSSESVRRTLLVLASTYPRWVNDPEPGFVHELSKRLASRFRVIAVVPDAQNADPSGEMDGVEVVRYRYAPRRWQTLVNNGGIVTNLKRSPWKFFLVPFFVLSQYLAARRITRNTEVSVIHAHWLLPQGLIARHIARLSNVPFVVTSHGGDLFGLKGKLPTILKRKVAGSCAAMTVVSAAMRDEAAMLGLTPGTITVLPMGADFMERFTCKRDSVRSRDELLFVGRLVPKKGLSYLIDAIPMIRKVRPQTFLTIVGFGPEEASLKDQVKRLEIDDAVTFVGATAQDKLPAYYRRAALLVAPFVRDESGNQEGLPVVLTEAIACGCPAVVGEVAGIEDLLGDEASTVCVDPKKVGELSSAVLSSLADPAAAQARALAIRQTISTRLDWGSIASAYADLIDRCIDKGTESGSSG